jgi:hypothetical protein
VHALPVGAVHEGNQRAAVANLSDLAKDGRTVGAHHLVDVAHARR